MVSGVNSLFCKNGLLVEEVTLMSRWMKKTYPVHEIGH